LGLWRRQYSSVVLYRLAAVRVLFGRGMALVDMSGGPIRVGLGGTIWCILGRPFALLAFGFSLAAMSISDGVPFGIGTGVSLVRKATGGGGRISRIFQDAVVCWRVLGLASVIVLMSAGMDWVVTLRGTDCEGFCVVEDASDILAFGGDALDSLAFSGDMSNSLAFGGACSCSVCVSVIAVGMVFCAVSSVDDDDDDDDDDDEDDDEDAFAGVSSVDEGVIGDPLAGLMFCGVSFPGRRVIAGALGVVSIGVDIDITVH